MKIKKVLLGMSGGVDSSVAAMMLQEAGYKVLGITFIFSHLNDKSVENKQDLQKLTQDLKIEHTVIDLRKDFEKIVVNYFVNEYKIGRTPFPCAVCNPALKFKSLLMYADLYNCDFISTGHYVKEGKYNDKNYIFQGIDEEKDQSFFLWRLDEDIRERLLFPLGSYTKKEIREYANERGFKSLSAKKDSLGVCFIGTKNYRKFLKDSGVDARPGNFVDFEDNIIGRHKGITNYTIGQRRGLGLKENKPYFVSEIRPEKDEIVLSEYSALYKNKIIVEDYYFVDLQEINFQKIFQVKVRYRLQITPCKIKLLNKNTAEIYLTEPIAMIAKGQTAVFYDGERLVGGGFIRDSE